MADFWLPILVFLASSLILVKAGSLAVKYILEIAKIVRISPFLASFVIAAFVSILPEFFIGVNSALEGATDIGIGALVGNNIVDLTLVVGIIVILGKDIPVPSMSKTTMLPFLVAVGLPLALMLDGVISRFDGLILIGGCVLYFAWMIYREPWREGNNKIQLAQVSTPLFLFTIMMGVIFFSSRLVVETSLELAHGFGFPEIFAGLFLISIGAALPELTFSVNAVLSRHKSIALADIFGNVALDAMFSIGVMAIITPLPIQFGVIGIAAIFVVFAALLLTTYLNNDGKLTRRDGVALIGLYVVFVVVQLTISTLSGASAPAPH